MVEFLSQFESYIKKEIQDAISQHPIIKGLSDKQVPEPSSSRYMTRKHAADYIDYSVGTIDKWAREGKLHPIYPNGKKSVRYDKEELDQIMQTFKVK